MKQLLFLPVLILFCVISQVNIAAAKSLRVVAQQPASNIKTVDGKGAKEVLVKQQGAILLDVRTPGEYAGGHLKNALNLDYNASDFAFRLTKLDKNKTYVVYCAVGGRSSKAAKLMQDMGFRQVYNVSEGYTGLKKAGIPVVEKAKEN